MTLARAAVVWTLCERIRRATTKQHDEAAETLKAYFRRNHKATSYAGITFTTTPTTRLSATLARALLGNKAEQCEVPGVRETLHLPADAKPYVVKGL